MATQPFATAIETPQLSYIRTFKESLEEIPYRRLWILTKSAALPEYPASARGLMRLLAITAGGDFHSAPRTFAVCTCTRRLPAMMRSLPSAAQVRLNNIPAGTFRSRSIGRHHGLAAAMVSPISGGPTGS